MTVSASFSSPRVLIVGVKWPPETFLARLIRGLAARGVPVSIVVAARPTAEWRQLANIDFLMAPGWDGSAVGRLARTGGQLAAASLRSLPETRRVFRLERERESTTSFMAHFVFKIVPVLPVGPVVAALVMVPLLTLFTGLLSGRGVTDHPPLQVLRQET